MTEPAASQGSAQVSIADFKKIELRTAKVVSVEEHPNADRLWVVKVEIAPGETKQIVAGIRAHYPKEELVGKTVVVVNNLEPAVLRGVESRGMLLAAKSGEAFTILTSDRPIPPGSPVS